LNAASKSLKIGSEPAVDERFKAVSIFEKILTLFPHDSEELSEVDSTIKTFHFLDRQMAGQPEHSTFWAIKWPVGQSVQLFESEIHELSR
jgi:hypothetical protein